MLRKQARINAAKVFQWIMSFLHSRERFPLQKFAMYGTISIWFRLTVPYTKQHLNYQLMSVKQKHGVHRYAQNQISSRHNFRKDGCLVVPSFSRDCDVVILESDSCRVWILYFLYPRVQLESCFHQFRQPCFHLLIKCCSGISLQKKIISNLIQKVWYFYCIKTIYSFADCSHVM